MSAAQLALHLASIPGNVARESAELMETFDRSVASLRDVLARLDDAAANAPWRLTFGDREIAAWSRATLVRTMGLNHWSTCVCSVFRCRSSMAEARTRTRLPRPRHEHTR
jgi:hypothetical protein